MSTPPSPGTRRDLVGRLVHTWRGRLAEPAKRALSAYDIEALEGMVSAAIEVILSRSGTIPGLTHATDLEFASMRQNLDLRVLDGLRELETRVPPDPGAPLVGVGHEQVDPAVVAELLYRAVDYIEEQRIRLADKDPAIAPTCKGCVHYNGAACFHPSKDGPTITDPSARPSWCPGHVPR